MSQILVSSDGGVTRITINRPDARNALTVAVTGELEAAFTAAGKDAACRVIVFSGAGTAAFCAGADLKELHERGTATAREDFFKGVAGLVESMSRCPKPIIAKVHGFALAGGCGLAGAADLICASEEASFGLPEVKIGLVPMIVMAPLMRSMPRKTLVDMVLTGESITAKRAYDIGFVSRLYPAASLDKEVDAIASKMAGLSSDALSSAKLASYQISEGDYFNLLNTLPASIAALSLRPDAMKGIESFLARGKK